MREIGPGVYVETSYRGVNLGLVLTGEGAIVIDTPMIPAAAHRWSEQVAAQTDEPLIYVVNTDHHRGHALGNQFFPVPVITHELAWKDLKSYTSVVWRQRLIDSFRETDPDLAAELEDLRVVLPQITFTRRLTLYRGQRLVHLIHAGGHTPATTMVYLPEERILFSGDVVVNGQQPYMGQCNSKQWLKALTYIRKMQVDTIVPGHGDLCDKEATQPLSQYIRQMRAGVRRLYKAGRSKTETHTQMAEMKGFFPISDEERDRIDKRFKASVGRVYDEMKATFGPIKK